MKIKRDSNGNKILAIQGTKGQLGFSVQTLGNLPETHRKGLCEATQGELLSYVANYGTARQKAICGLNRA